ncbi:phosphate ABC transporter substrate-binding/OmpA family protein [Marinicella sp. W31]|uniref:phosphate ABC transporter substrate-binding/OmpA family protein n=1 Tax=Marinicella sp. W31 TaxID=3023713 RepID=UPI003756C7F6
MTDHNPNLFDSPQQNAKTNLMKNIAILIATTFLLINYSSEAFVQDNQLQIKQPVTLPVNDPNIILSLHGSNTIGQNLAPRLAKEFLVKLGAQTTVEVPTTVENEKVLQAFLPEQNQVVGIEIEAHGSSTAFSGLQGKTSDIGMSSRPIKQEENLELMIEHGDLTLPQHEHIVGLDGLAIIIHPSNPIQSIHMKQLAQIFSGTIANWSQLGGPDLPIQLYARDSKSGTFDTFKSLVLSPYNTRLSTKSNRFESNAKLSQQVNNDPAAIGFTGLAYIENNKLLKIAASENSKPFLPTAFVVNTEDYPLARRLYLYKSNKSNNNAFANQFIEFALSDRGQEIVEQESFVSQKIFAVQPEHTQETPAGYQLLTSNMSRLSLNFRLKSESSVLDTKAQRDLDRLADYLASNNSSKIIVVGFSDNLGKVEENKNRSLRRAAMVAYGLKKRGIRSIQVEGFGAAMPIAEDSTAQGRFKNNRTEIWIKQSNSLASNP